MIEIDSTLTPQALAPSIARMWEVSATCLDSLEQAWHPEQGAPVFTIAGKYAARGWTEWTQGFQFGSLLLQFDATGEQRFLDLGRDRTRQRMAPHVSHVGVHDHGFNNISTYGALRRLMLEERIPFRQDELDFYELALKTSGAVQASRWNRIADGGGYIASFNGPHSLFADTIRSLRSLALAHLLGHQLMGENDEAISLLDRLLQHARATAEFNVYYGESRDLYDVRGRVAHESVFNTNDGRYRCPSSQQGYSPFTTWTRGAAWIILGFAEQLEFLNVLAQSPSEPIADLGDAAQLMTRAACAASDYFLEETPADGVPYWDTGAPGLAHMGNYRSRSAEPFNDYEPVDSSAAAIAAQGLIRLGRLLADRQPYESQRYFQAGLGMLKTLLAPPYLNENPAHQGLLLHSIYHRPRGWDYIPEGARIPCGESSQWGDYHLREAALLVQRLAEDSPYYTFFGPAPA